MSQPPPDGDSTTVGAGVARRVPATAVLTAQNRCSNKLLGCTVSDKEGILAKGPKLAVETGNYAGGGLVLGRVCKRSCETAPRPVPSGSLRPQQP